VAIKRIPKPARSPGGEASGHQEKLFDGVVDSDSNETAIRASPPWVPTERLIGPLNQLEAKYAPKRIYISGAMHLPLLHPRVAVIGTREPSDDGLELARSLASALARKGVLIVSGLARGIDTAAHVATIGAGGSTLAVIGTPLSKSYPAENAKLQAQIGRDFMVISQFEEGRPTLPSNFILRNRTMALVADATVIVESGDSGGSLHQGWEALRLGRPLFIHTKEFKRPGIEWPKKMADYGAVEFTKPSDILEAVPRLELSLESASALST
jgi:DNA processing protein